MICEREEQERGEEEKEEEIRVAKVGAWVLVEFSSKRDKKHFVGQIIEMNKEEDEYVVKYLRKSGLHFAWPEKEDISLVGRNDIIAILPEPAPGRRGGKVIFKIKFDTFNVQ